MRDAERHEDQDVAQPEAPATQDSRAQEEARQLRAAAAAEARYLLSVRAR